MKQNIRRQMSETFFLGALLAVVGGFLDSYTYLARGHVFANAQTGNIVLLGLNLSTGNFAEGLYYLVPITAFALGIIIAEFVKSKFKTYPKIHWRQIIIAAETVVLFVVANLPHGPFDVISNVLVSFTCALQVEAFRKVNGNTFATTMCTGNLRSATEMLFRYGQTREPHEIKKSLQYYGIILFFLTGTALGAILTRQFHTEAVLFCCLMLIIVFLAMFIEHEIER